PSKISCAPPLTPRSKTYFYYHSRSRVQRAQSLSSSKQFSNSISGQGEVRLRSSLLVSGLRSVRHLWFKRQLFRVLGCSVCSISVRVLLEISSK
ncbi:hypothetical protein A4A49_39322, partial [Nicotiana attenuata]